MLAQQASASSDDVQQATGFLGLVLVVYYIEVANNGPDGATSVVVTELLPAALSYASDTCGAADAAPWTWNVGSLANGASVSCQITADIVNFGQVENTASVTAAEDDLEPDNYSAVAALQVLPPTTTTSSVDMTTTVDLGTTTTQDPGTTTTAQDPGTTTTLSPATTSAPTTTTTAMVSPSTRRSPGPTPQVRSN